MGKNKGKPIVVLFPWLGSTPGLIAKYSVLYEVLGLSVKIKVLHILDFFWPQRGIQSAVTFLDHLEKELENQQCPIIIHAMSIGCYFYNILLYLFATQPQKYAKIRNNICCQIVDSPVVGTLREMAKGSVKPLTDSTKLQCILEKMLMLYFATSRPYTVWYYDKFVDIFKNKPVNVPSLLLTSIGDKFAPKAHFESLVDAWTNNKQIFSVVVWDDSEHCAHLKHHPQEYKEAIYKLLNQALPDLVLRKSVL